MKLPDGIEMRAYQPAAIEGVRDAYRGGAKRALLVAPTGCHHPDAELLLADGTLKRAQWIDVGDKLAAPGGVAVDVHTLHRGRQPMARIVPTKGESFVVNMGHLLSLRETGTGWLRDVSVAQWLTWSKTERHTWKLWSSAANFEVMSAALPIDPYFLGVLIGDGGLQRQINVSTPDPEIVTEVYAQAERWGCTIRVEDNPASRANEYFFRTPRGQKNPLKVAITRLGLACRSNDKWIPPAYLTASRDVRLRLLAGLLDTDGHLHNNCFEFTSASLCLARDTQFLARSLGFRATFSVKPVNGKDYYRLNVSGHTDLIPTRIARKQAIPREQSKSPLVSGFTVEALPEGEYFGFGVTGQNRYLDANFRVQHNSGKTVCASEIIRGAEAKGSKVLFLAHRRELVFQCSAKLAQFGVRHGIIMAGEAPMDALCQVASIQTLTSRKRLPDCDLLVIDECHRSLAKTYMDLIARYTEQGARVLGLTATPIRGDGKGLGDVYERMVCCPGISALTEAGYLVPVKYYAPTIPDLSGLQMRAGDYVASEAQALMNKDTLVGDVVENWLRLGEGRKTVVFAAGVDHSIHLAGQFQEAGVAAMHVDGSTPKVERDAVLNSLRRGTLSVVTQCDVLTEGWDMPDVSVACIARPTKSLVRFLQMAGRILRPAPGKSHATLIDHSGVIYEHGFLAEFGEWNLEASRGDTPNDTQRERKAKDAKPLVCERCTAVFTRTLECPECGEMYKRKGRDVNVIDAVLGEITAQAPEAKKGEYSENHKRRFYKQLCGYAHKKGYKRGWAFHAYQKKFKQAPNSNWPDKVCNPGPEVQRWIKSLAIAYRKGREAEQAARDARYAPPRGTRGDMGGASNHES